MGHSHCGRIDEARPERFRFVGVAAESHPLSSFVTPPSQDRRIEWNPGVDLQRAVFGGQGPERLPELVLVVVRVEWPTVCWPAPDWIVDMTEYVKQSGTGHHLRDLAQVRMEHLVCREARKQFKRFGELISVGQTIKRTDDPVECALGQQVGQLIRVAVRLTYLHSGKNP